MGDWSIWNNMRRERILKDKLIEARAWARMLRNRALIAEQNSDSACAAYRKMFEMWAKAEREKQELLWRLAEAEAQRDNLQQQRDELKDAINQNYHIRIKLIKERDELQEQNAELDQERGMLSDAWVELHEQNAELVAALKDLVSACQSCGGTGIYYNSRDCRYCRVGRFALAKLE